MNNPTLDLLSQASTFTSGTGVVTFVFTLAMLIYWTGVFFILYHLIRFGVSGQPKKLAIIFLGGSILLSLITTLFYVQAVLAA